MHYINSVIKSTVTNYQQHMPISKGEEALSKFINIDGPNRIYTVEDFEMLRDAYLWALESKKTTEEYRIKLAKKLVSVMDKMGITYPDLKGES